MSNGNQLERLWKLQTKVNMLVSDGKRDPKAIADIYQQILEGSVGRSWREEDGVIRFSVTSDGTTGEDWIYRLKNKGLHVVVNAKRRLKSPDFKPTNGVTTEIAVLRGSILVGQIRNTVNIRDFANGKGLFKPNAEIACLIREKFSDNEIEAMGLECIVAMHEPISDSTGTPRLLCASRDNGGRWLDEFNGGPLYDMWLDGDGFAFAVSQVSSHTKALGT